MRSGYLSIETHRDRPGVVRLFLSSQQPPGPAPGVDDDPRIRYVARFNDREAALMHVHELVKRRLLDPDTHLYRVPLERAIAAAESLALKHKRVYIDPGFTDEALISVESLATRYRAKSRSKEQIFQTMGYIGIGLLLFNMLFLSFL